MGGAGHPVTKRSGINKVLNIYIYILVWPVSFSLGINLFVFEDVASYNPAVPEPEYQWDVLAPETRHRQLHVAMPQHALSQPRLKRILSVALCDVNVQSGRRSGVKNERRELQARTPLPSSPEGRAARFSRGQLG